jgi:hypothetical protein
MVAQQRNHDAMIFIAFRPSSEHAACGRRCCGERQARLAPAESQRRISMTSTSRKFLLGAGLLALSATAAAAVPAVVRSDLNMRSGPGTNYAVVGSLPGGATVDVGDCTGRWCVVAYGGEQGYAARSYLDLGAAGVPAEPAYGPSYGYVEPGYVEPDYYYGDDYYYGGYGPGVTLGFGFYGDRYRHRGQRWHRGRGDRDRDMANRPNDGRGRVGMAPNFQPRGNRVDQSQGFRSRQSLSGPQGGSFSRGGSSVFGNQMGARSSGSATVGSGAPVGRSAPAISAGGGGRGGPSGGGAAATVGAGSGPRQR